MNSADRWTPRLARCAAAGVLAAACALALAAPDRKGTQFYEDALQRFEKKDYGGAIVQLKNALQIDKNALPVHLLLGKALMANRDAGAAEVAFDEALRLGVDRAEVVVPLARAVDAQGRPEDVLGQQRFADAGLPAAVKAQLLLVKASAAAEMGRTRESLKFLEDARALDSSSADNWLAEVPIRLRQQQFREALLAADQALKLAPTSATALYSRGQVPHLQGDLNGALAYYDRSLQLQPNDADTLLARAGILLDLQRVDEAGRDIAALRRAAPTDPRGAYLAALLAERAGDTTAARAALSTVTDLLDAVPSRFLRYRPQLLILGGVAHHGLGELEKARPYLEAVVRQQSNSPVLKLLATVYLRLKEPDLAIQSLTTYLRAYPADTKAQQLLASAQMSKGRYAESVALMRDSLKQQDTPALRSLLGMSLLGTGKLQEGAGELEAVLKKEPGNLRAGSTLASLYLQAGYNARALAIVQGLLKRAPDNAALHNLLGLALQGTGDVKGARSAFEKAAQAAPTLSAPRVSLARLDISAKDYDAAGKRLNDILARNEKDVDALTEAARLSELRGRTLDAQHFLEKADDFSGSNLQPGLQLVDFHLDRNHPELARDALKRLLGKQPEAMAVRLALARVQMANGDNTSARATLDRAAAQVPTDAPLLTQIATLQLRAGNRQGAAAALGKALAARPDHPQANVLMAGLDIQQRNFAQAEQRIRGLVASNPKSGVGATLQGDLALARDKRPAAVEAYRRAHQLEQTSGSLLRLYLAMAPDDPNGAAQLAQQWLKSRPGDVELLRALGDNHARTGNFAAARASYEALLKVAPDDVPALNNLAILLVMARDPTALAVAERALRLRPDAAHILGTTGWAAFHAGQSDRALQLLRDARLRDPDNADTRYFLGAVLLARGRKDEAREELQGALHGQRPLLYRKEAETALLAAK